MPRPAAAAAAAAALAAGAAAQCAAPADEAYVCEVQHGANATALQAALQWACGAGGVDCAAIQPGASCDTGTIQGNAAYAFERYYIAHRPNRLGPDWQDCDFSGSAVLVKVGAKCGGACPNGDLDCPAGGCRKCWNGVCDPCEGQTCASGACASDRCDCSYSFCKLKPVVPTPVPAPTPAPPASPCSMLYSNQASTPITLCLRHNGDTPGLDWHATVPAGGSVSRPCLNNSGLSWETLLAARGVTSCGWDMGCGNGTQDTGTCHTYPWIVGQGIGSAGDWHGYVAANWDGAGLGYVYPYGAANVSYGLEFSCIGYPCPPPCQPEAIDVSCTVAGGQPSCPNGIDKFGKPDSGVVECQATQTLKLTIRDA